MNQVMGFSTSKGLVSVQDKKEQRDLVQRTINAKSLLLLRLLVAELKLNCSGCFLHGIVAKAPLDLLATLVRLAGSLNARHPELKSTLIHKVQLHAYVMPPSTLCLDCVCVMLSCCNDAAPHCVMALTLSQIGCSITTFLLNTKKSEN